MQNIESQPTDIEMMEDADFEDMLGQVLALEQMVSDREAILITLAHDRTLNAAEIIKLETEIKELKEEVTARKELMD